MVHGSKSSAGFHNRTNNKSEQEAAAMSQHEILSHPKAVQFFHANECSSFRDRGPFWMQWRHHLLGAALTGGRPITDEHLEILCGHGGLSPGNAGNAISVCIWTAAILTNGF